MAEITASLVKELRERTGSKQPGHPGIAIVDTNSDPDGRRLRYPG